MNENIKEDFVPHNEAKVLIELGFDYRCMLESSHRKECDSKVGGVCPLPNVHCNYPDCETDKSIEPVSLPLFQQAFRWFRKEHKLGVDSTRDGGWWVLNVVDYSNEDEEGPTLILVDGSEEYEDTELSCLRKLIEIVKNKDE